MERRTFLRGTALAGTVLLAGCSGGDDNDGAESSTPDGESETPPPAGASPTETTIDPAGTTPTETAVDPTEASATPDAETETLSDSEVVDLSGSPCEAIAGATFNSIEKRDGGPAPPGSDSQIHWVVRFSENGGFEYAYSDVVESGEYSCTVEDGTATVEGSSTSGTYSGSYAPESGVLVWEGVRYRPVEGS